MEPPANTRSPSKLASKAKGNNTNNNNKRFADDSKFLLDASHLSHETEEKKESIINEGLNCIFLELPKLLFRLDDFLQELVQLEKDFAERRQMERIPECYGNVMGVNPQETLLNVLKEKQLQQQKKDEAEKKKDKKRKIKLDTKKNKRINLLETMCGRHFDSKRKVFVEEEDEEEKKKKQKDGKKDEEDDNSTVALNDHVCFTSYSFPEILNLMPSDSVVPSNDQMNNVFDKLRSLFIHLSKNFVKINLGLLLMFPKTEDNEVCNLSITVLNKLLRLTSLELIDMQLFRTYIEARAGKVKYIWIYPHIGEAQRILFQYDWDVVFTLTLVIRDLITQCSILYDSLIKNFDAIIKVKEQCTKERRKGKNHNKNNRNRTNNNNDSNEDSEQSRQDKNNDNRDEDDDEQLADKNSNIYS